MDEIKAGDILRITTEGYLTQFTSLEVTHVPGKGNVAIVELDGLNFPALGCNVMLDGRGVKIIGIEWSGADGPLDKGDRVGLVFREIDADIGAIP